MLLRAPVPLRGRSDSAPALLLPAALAHLRIFRAGWLNHVATRRCQSLWKCGFRIMPFLLGAMAAACCRGGEDSERPGRDAAAGSRRASGPARGPAWTPASPRSSAASAPAR